MSGYGGKDGFMDGFIGKEQEMQWRKEQDTSWRKKPECNRSKRRERTDSSRKKREKSLMEKRARRHKLFLDLAQKAWYKHENELKFQEQIAFARKEVSSAILKQQSIERATGESARLDANPAVLSKASSDLAQAYVFFKIPSARVNPRPKVGR